MNMFHNVSGKTLRFGMLEQESLIGPTPFVIILFELTDQQLEIFIFNFIVSVCEQESVYRPVTRKLSVLWQI